MSINMNDLKEKQLLEVLQKHQYLKIEDIAKKISVSTSTVRRHLNVLQQKGLIMRTHGGAKLIDDNAFLPSFTYRIHQNSFAKKKIALAAIKLIKNGDLIFLDGTTSAFFIAEYLSEFENIHVVTNGIDTLSLLSKNNVFAYSTGGFVQEENRSVLVGRHAENMINNFHADIAFFSAQSVSSDGQIYDCFEEENFIRKAMLRNAKVKVLLCDSTKFSKTSPYHLCALSDIDYVISDDPLPSSIMADTIQQIITN